MARWFGPPYNAWFVGKVDHINKRRTKQENVCVAFNDKEYGETHGMFVADAATYGADKLWCLLKPITIDLSDDDESGDGEAGEPTAKRAKVSGGASSSQ